MKKDKKILIDILEPGFCADDSAKQCLLKCYIQLSGLKLDKRYVDTPRGHFDYLYNMCIFENNITEENYSEACCTLADIIHDDLIHQPHVWYNVMDILKGMKG